MVDIEATGGLITGGMIAGAVEKPTGHAGEAHSGTCSDCGEPVTANFCANCGQPTHVHRTLLHLGEELLHGVMHFDARIWRTLPLLLLNPGKLTREWIHGRRTRYVSPLAIFLFTVFLMFFLLSFAGGGIVQQEPLEQRIASAREAVAEAEAELAEARSESTVDDPGAEGVIAGAEAAVEGAKTSLRSLEEARTAGPRADGLTPGSWQAGVADAVHDRRVQIGIGDEKLKEKILHKLANPDFALYKIQQTLYKFAFLLVPLSIPFVWLLFAWKRGFTWYDHGVFVLYSLTFMSILFMGQLASGMGPGWMGAITSAAVFWIIPIHMFAQLKGTYGLSIFSALWRTVALLIFCFFVLVFFILGIIVLGLTS
ncbi:DUF3667 domain-containing protein [Brevundimonas sp. AJA228-03]|uniref:DUF3667 domain-containing protein n=1 Tax=Brevundimonas sp. AJA228-03 TaxID=2752515 RepID=UPI001ADED9CA|nr:DUF3667 domain-containing protein [Brevundimonas sp. AJA228-03]